VWECYLYTNGEDKDETCNVEATFLIHIKVPQLISTGLNFVGSSAPVIIP
jgi:hypothetical protein